MTDQYILINGDTLIVSREWPTIPDLHVGATLHTPDGRDYRWNASAWILLTPVHQEIQP